MTSFRETQPGGEGRFGRPPRVVEDNAVVMGVVNVMAEKPGHRLEFQSLVGDQLGTAGVACAAKPHDHPGAHTLHLRDHSAPRLLRRLSGIS